MLTSRLGRATSLDRSVLDEMLSLALEQSNVLEIDEYSGDWDREGAPFLSIVSGTFSDFGYLYAIRGASAALSAFAYVVFNNEAYILQAGPRKISARPSIPCACMSSHDREQSRRNVIWVLPNMPSTPSEPTTNRFIASLDLMSSR